jgi:cation:H+ antiporter
LIEFLIFVVSLVALYYGAKFMTDGATHVAKVLGISEFVIGATVVAFGTSLPELASSIIAMVTDGGYPGIVVGNVIGSNIANIGLALGFAGMVYFIYIDREIIETDIPFLIASALALLVVFIDLRVTRLEGVILILMYLAFIHHEITQHAKNGTKGSESLDPRTLLLFTGGMILLYFGAKYLISSILDISVIFGISEAVIAFILVAFGTSVPEVMTSVVAAKEGRGDIAMGNVVGSNTFNSLIVLGGSALIGPIYVEASFLYAALPSMILISLLLGFMVLDSRISRFEGALLFMIYCIIILNIL